MAARKLRAVKDDEAPRLTKVAAAVREGMSLPDAVATGDYVKILVAQRAEIAASIPDEKGPAKAALHRQLSIIAKELSEIDAKERQEAGEDGDKLEGDAAWDASAI